MKTLAVDLWSDIACPWCYVGQRRLAAALARFGERDRVEVRWRAFELDPTAPPVREPPMAYAERLAKKYGISPAEAEQRMASLTRTAAEDGLDLRFERVVPGNTFDAHRLLHLAGLRGRAEAAHERLFRAYFSEGQAIGRPEVLIALAGELGLDAGETRALFAGDLYAADVRADEAEAQAMGIHGVPFYAIGQPAGRRYGISGAQPAEALLSALRRAWTDLEDRHPDQ